MDADAINFALTGARARQSQQPHRPAEEAAAIVN